MREIMTPEQVAGYLQLTTDTVYRLIRQRQLAATRIGRAYRIPKEDLERFLVSRSNRSFVREAQFRQALAIGQAHSEESSDALLEALEREDHDRATRPTPRP